MNAADDTILAERLQKGALALSAALLLLCGCVREPAVTDGDSPGAAENTITLRLRGDGAATRSFLGNDASLDAFEGAMNDITLFRYIVSGKSVRLEGATYMRLDGRDEVSVTGLEGVRYRFYALLNCGDRTSGAVRGSSDADLSSLSVAWGREDRSIEGGIPAVAGPVDVTAVRDGEASLRFTRLASRWDLRLSADLPHGGTFTPTSLRIRQSPRSTYPFRGVNVFKVGDESLLEDGDYASSGDLARLAAGDSVRFYTLENACGELISNPLQDPWLKAPDGEGASVAGHLPTYIELSGVYRSPQGGALAVGCTYRMFLGKDTWKDFTVSRGEQRRLLVTVTEAPTVEGYAPAASWKLETTVLDKRSFAFSPSSLTLDSGEERRIGVTDDRYKMTYHLSGEGAFLERVSFDPSAMTLRSLPGKRSCSGFLVARYAGDGRTADSLRVTLSAFSGTPADSPLAMDARNTYLGPESHAIHDPSCPVNHSRVHRSDCAVNHSDASRPDYVDIRDCPNYRSTAEDCKFTVPSEADYSKGEAALTVSVEGGWRVSGGALRCDTLEPEKDYTITDVYLCTRDGKARHRADVTIRKNGRGSYSVTLSDMDNAPDCFWWHVRIRTSEGLVKHYVYGGLMAGDDQGRDYTFPAETAEASLKDGKVSCSNKDRLLWAVYDPEYLSVSNADGESGGTFRDGDRAEIKVLKAGGKQKVYLLDRDGIVTGESEIDTGK